MSQYSKINWHFPYKCGLIYILHKCIFEAPTLYIQVFITSYGFICFYIFEHSHCFSTGFKAIFDFPQILIRIQFLSLSMQNVNQFSQFIFYMKGKTY